MSNIQLFMKVYMYELEAFLSNCKRELLKISFQSDEANTDRPLKEYLKDVIENHCNCISGKIKELNIKYSSTQVQSYPITDEIESIYVEEVLLPEDITDEIRVILSERKNAVFTNPDICLKINDNGNTFYETIELKSTKNDSIPGSSVQQINPEEWVIFIKHNSKSVFITTGLYLNAINAKMQFPDRSPRPQVAFSELEVWNNSYRQQYKNTLYYTSSGDDMIKKALLTDWQGVLAKRWKEVLFTFDKSKKEPWFNNALRKFILCFLNDYDGLSKEKKEEYKVLISSLIDE